MRCQETNLSSADKSIFPEVSSPLTPMSPRAYLHGWVCPVPKQERPPHISSTVPIPLTPRSTSSCGLGMLCLAAPPATSQSHCKDTPENAALPGDAAIYRKQTNGFSESIFPPSKGSAAILAKCILVSQRLTLSRGRKGWEVTGLTTCRMPGALLSSRSDRYQTLNHCSPTQECNSMPASLSQG